MGDLLFAIANLSRKLDIEPEAALRRANDKFTRRFEQLERRVHERGRTARELDAGRNGSGVAKSQGRITNRTTKTRRLKY